MNKSKPVSFDVIKNRLHEIPDMGKEDRKRMVLDLLESSGFALPPSVIFRNLKLRGATFEQRSVNTYLDELVEEGRVTRVNKDALEDGRLAEAGDAARGYFIAQSAVEESDIDLEG